MLDSHHTDYIYIYSPQVLQQRHLEIAYCESISGATTTFGIAGELG